RLVRLRSRHESKRGPGGLVPEAPLPNVRPPPAVLIGCGRRVDAGLQANLRGPTIAALMLAMEFDALALSWSECFKRHGIPALFAVKLLLAILGLVPSDIKTTRQLVERHA